MTIAAVSTRSIPVAQVRYVKDLYPRLQPDDATIDAYRLALDALPPITVARDGILVDGYHRWQAHVREGVGFIEADDLGELSDEQIFWESVERNARHGKQLLPADKRKIAELRYESFQPKSAVAELAAHLRVDERTVRRWTKDARKAQEAYRRERAYDLWLDCLTQEQIAEELDTSQQNIANWLDATKNGQLSEVCTPPGASDERPWGNVQHFDVWDFSAADGDTSFFGRMPEQVIENLLWFYTEPRQIIVDPFAGGGTTITVGKRMGRRVWASDLHPAMPTLPIHKHNMMWGWPDDAPDKADLIVLDPPYWEQAKGRYSDDPDDLGNMSLVDFETVWTTVIHHCAEHLAQGGHVAYIISPTERDDGTVVDHATDLLELCRVARLRVTRRIIVPYQTQQATGQHVTWAREHRRLLKRYRDLVVLEPDNG